MLTSVEEFIQDHRCGSPNLQKQGRKIRLHLEYKNKMEVNSLRNMLEDQVRLIMEEKLLRD